jgi:hypothetical protein
MNAAATKIGTAAAAKPTDSDGITNNTNTDAVDGGADGDILGDGPDDAMRSGYIIFTMLLAGMAFIMYTLWLFDIP